MDQTTRQRLFHLHAVQFVLFYQPVTDGCQEIAPALTAQVIVLIERRDATPQGITGQRLRRENLEDAQLAGRLLNKLLDAVVTLFVVLQDAHHLLQAAFAQPVLHAFHPLRRVVHLRRHGADHHDGIRATAIGFFNRDRIADATVLIADAVQLHSHAVKTGDGAGCFNGR
ncbi:hypothetical protein D3C73_1229850 [compost metagenome]